MKRYLRKVSIIFVMVFAIIGLKNEFIVSAATRGSQLLQPESGWRRYDNTESKILYDSHWVNTTRADNVYGGSYHQNSNTVGSKIKFQFSGTKLRIITWMTYDCSGANVKIDGIDYGNYSDYCDSGKHGGSYLFFEKTGLVNSSHRVEITTLNRSAIAPKSSNNYFALDAIDIDNNGSLESYNENIISMNKTKIMLDDKEEEKLIALSNGVPSNASNFIWTSSNDSIAKVDGEGNVIGVNSGEALITAQLKNTNWKVSCNVSVSKRILKVKSNGINVDLNKNVDVFVSLDNVNDIHSILADIKYDNSKLELIDTKCEEDICFLSLIKGDNNIQTVVMTNNGEGICNEKKLLRLRFKAISKGEALVKVSGARISDDVSMDRNLSEKECGQRKILIK